MVLQPGTACATEALQAANHVADCVKAVDLNMGYPVKFSVQGGMGSALLTEPEKVRDILTTLRRNLPASLPVTCKIRLLEDFKDTLQLAQLIERYGVQALAVHARRKHHRPRHGPSGTSSGCQGRTAPRRCSSSSAGTSSLQATSRARWSFTVGRFAPRLPVAPRGTPSIFAVRYPPVCPMAPKLRNRAKQQQRQQSWQRRQRRRRRSPGRGRKRRWQWQHGDSGRGGGALHRAVRAAAHPSWQCEVHGATDARGSRKTEPFQMLQRAKTQADLNAAATACRSHPHFARPGGTFVPASLEPPPDIPDARPHHR